MLKIVLVLSALCISASFGMECSIFGSDNVIERIINSCPGLLDKSELSYCCPDIEGKVYCCTLTQFILTGAVLAIPLVLPILVISLLASCVCCCCWFFCGVFKRRNGRVF